MLRYEVDLYRHFLVKLHRQLDEEQIDIETNLKALRLAQVKERGKCQNVISKCSSTDCSCKPSGELNVKFLRCHVFATGEEYHFVKNRIDGCRAKKKEFVNVA